MHFLEDQHCQTIDIHIYISIYIYIYTCIVVAGAIIVSSVGKISVA